MIIISVDPGFSKGGIAVRSPDGLHSWSLSKHDPVKIFKLITELLPADDYTVVIEQVHAMPKQGVSSTFKFGQGYGYLIGAALSMGFKVNMITPQAWQKTFNLSGDKSFRKRQIKGLVEEFVQQKALKITLENADALLMLKYLEDNGLTKAKPFIYNAEVDNSNKSSRSKRQRAKGVRGADNLSS